MTEKLRVVATVQSFHPYTREECERIVRTAVFDEDTPAGKIMEWACGDYPRATTSVTLHFDDSQSEIIDARLKDKRLKFIMSAGGEAGEQSPVPDEMPF